MDRREFVRQGAYAALLAAMPGTMAGVSREGGEAASTGPDAESVRKLAASIAGTVVTPESGDYDAARSIFNLAFDRHPGAIVRCAAPGDVARGVEFARTRRLPLAIRSGGHSRLGYGMCDGGVVIDLSRMRHVEVDAGRRVARVQAGALVRDLDEACQRFGLATTSGGCPTVGVTGFTLGGGEGRLMEKFGAACDNVLSARVVTVDGREVEANLKENADLFWALRGGGGNFGVVTSLELQLHSVGTVVSGGLTYAGTPMPMMLHAFAKFLAAAPDEMDAFAQLFPSPQGPRFKIDVCHCGEPRAGVELLKPLLALRPLEDTVREQPYVQAQAAGGFLQKPIAHFQTNVVVRELSDAVIAALTTAIGDAPATCKTILVPLRGAVSRVRVSEMAFALRQPGVEIDITGVWSTPMEKDQAVRWVKATRDELLPFAHGVYVNQLGDTSEQLVRAAYGPNYARLVEIKRKWDPTNVLRLNQNITP